MPCQSTPNESFYYTFRREPKDQAELERFMKHDETATALLCGLLTKNRAKPFLPEAAWTHELAQWWFDHRERDNAKPPGVL